MINLTLTLFNHVTFNFSFYIINNKKCIFGDNVPINLTHSITYLFCLLFQFLKYYFKRIYNILFIILIIKILKLNLKKLNSNFYFYISYFLWIKSQLISLPVTLDSPEKVSTLVSSTWI